MVSSNGIQYFIYTGQTGHKFYVKHKVHNAAFVILIYCIYYVDLVFSVTWKIFLKKTTGTLNMRVLFGIETLIEEGIKKNSKLNAIFS